MKASVEDDDSGWELSIPEKMEKSGASWVDITQDFEDACRGEFGYLDWKFGLWAKVTSNLDCDFGSVSVNQVSR